MLRLFPPIFRVELFFKNVLFRFDSTSKSCANFVAIDLGMAEIHCLYRKSTAQKHKPFADGRLTIQYGNTLCVIFNFNNIIHQCPVPPHGNDQHTDNENSIDKKNPC